MVEEKKFKEVSADVWKPKEEGDSIEGIYIRKQEEVGQYNSNTYVLEKDKVAMMIWGGTVIDDRMELVQTGD